MQSIIADLDRATGPRRDPRTSSGTGKSSGPDTVRAGSDRVANAHSPPVNEPELKDGYLVARRGRLVRASDGMLCFKPDSGSVGGSEPVFALLPCTTLTSLDAWADATGDGQAITLSGQVFGYRGRRYLMPQMYKVPRETDQVLPTQ